MDTVIHHTEPHVHTHTRTCTQTMQKAVPHFSERDDKGAGFRQQDAHECWSAIISNLAQVLKTENKAKFMEQYFGMLTLYTVNRVIVTRHRVIFRCTV